MPRKRKPDALKSSHLTKQEIQNGEIVNEEAKNVGGNPDLRTPAWIDKEAKKEYKRILDIMKPMEFLTEADKANLEGYAISYANWKKLSIDLQTEPLVIEQTNNGGSTNKVKNPKCQLQISYAEEMRKFASNLGLTLDSRLKIAAAKVEKQKDQVEDEFGDI